MPQTEGVVVELRMTKRQKQLVTVLLASEETMLQNSAAWEPNERERRRIFKDVEDLENVVEQLRNGTEPDPPPRALVALSEDRQWLVVLGLDGEFIVQEWDVGDDEYRPNYVSIKGIPDTGQSAEDVLAAWMEGREEADRAAD